jgi:hypothetical protein
MARMMTREQVVDVLMALGGPDYRAEAEQVARELDDAGTLRRMGDDLVLAVATDRFREVCEEGA